MPAVGAFHSFLIPFTNLQHRTARVARYSIPLRYIPYRATLAFPNAPPNAGKAVFVSRSVLFRKNISARVKCTPFGRPCIYRSLIRCLALRWVLATCRSLVLLHTLSPSSLAAISSPQTPSKVFAKLTIFFIGGLSLLSVFARLRVAAG